MNDRDKARQRPEGAPRPEYLVIRGRLDRAGQFTPRRCSSTPYVHAWPRGTSADELERIGAGQGEVVVETVSHEGETLHRELAQVRSEEVCAPGDARTFRVLAYIGLHPAAGAVRVRRDERVLWEMRIPEAAAISVRLERVPKRGRAAGKETDQDTTPQQPPRRGAGTPAVLTLDLSAPADPELAFVTVVHQWGPRGFRTVHVGPASRTVEIPVQALAGGPECRFLVTYSNGLRAATDVTDTFGLEPLGPSVTITRPARGDTLVAGVPVTLEGLVDDPEHPGGLRDPEVLVWTVDEEEAGSGPLTSVDALGPGRHEIRLVYRAEPGASAAVQVSVREAKEPTADQWPHWEAVELG